MTRDEARKAIVDATGKAIMAMPDDVRAEATKGEPFRFEIHIGDADKVDAVERKAAPKKRRRAA